MSTFIASRTGGSGSTSATDYVSIAGNNISFESTEAAAALTMPVTTDLTKLSITLTTAPGVGKNWTFAVMKNGSATGLTVTIADTATTATDLVNTASFTVGDTISLRSIPSGTPTTAGVIYINMVSSAVGQPLFFRAFNNTTSAIDNSIMGDGTASTINETRVQCVMPCAGSFSNLYAKVTAAPGGAASKTFTLRLNAAGSALTTAITGANTTNSDITNSVSVAATDRVCMEVAVAGSPASSSGNFSVLFTPTNAGDSVLLFGCNDDPSSTLTQYSFPQASALSWNTPETSFQLIIGEWVMKKFYARTNVASGAAKDYTFTIRLNATTDTALSVTCANTTTAQSVTADVSIASTDRISIRSVPNGTPTVSRQNMGILINAVSTSSQIKSAASVPTASVKVMAGVVIASVKKIAGVANV